jgi:hypothetical protein
MGVDSSGVSNNVRYIWSDGSSFFHPFTTPEFFSTEIPKILAVIALLLLASRIHASESIPTTERHSPPRRHAPSQHRLSSPHPKSPTALLNPGQAPAAVACLSCADAMAGLSYAPMACMKLCRHPWLAVVACGRCLIRLKLSAWCCSHPSRHCLSVTCNSYFFLTRMQPLLDAGRR